LLSPTSPKSRHPIPGDPFIDPAAYYTTHRINADLWTGEYGALRWDLLAFLCERIAAEL